MRWDLGNRRGRSPDRVTNALVNRGVYRVPEIHEDREKDRIVGSTVAYSFWSAVKYTFILSLFLWWLPIFGQMIAGYVGGRRAGSPNKAMLAALIPVLAIFAFMGLVNAGVIPTTIGGYDLANGGFLDYIAANMPMLAPFLTFTMDYMGSFFGAIQTTTSLALDSYVLTIAFAYVGGIMADQARRELQYVSEHGAPRTTVIVEPCTSPPHQGQPGSRAHPQGMSFESMTPIGGDPYIEERAASVQIPVTNVPEREFMPVRQERRQHDPNELQGIDPHLLRENAKRMTQEQRSMEKDMRRGNRGGRLSGLVSRSQRHHAEEPQTGQSQGGNEWEFI